MNDLIERLEKATEGSRELDAAIHCAANPGYGKKEDRVSHEVPHRSHDCAPGTYWRIGFSGRSLHTAPNYTTSVDAALTLVPEHHTVGLWSRSSRYKTEAWVHNGQSACSRVIAKAATWPLALCAAALRAREASRE